MHVHAVEQVANPDQSANSPPHNVSGLKSDEKLATYTPPKRLNPVPPTYPRIARIRADDGWVELNFMVSPEGKPYEITVSESIGDKSFIKAAISALKKTRFVPAMLDGVPIDAGSRLGTSFEIEGGSRGARRSFVSEWRTVAAMIENGELETAQKKLDEIRPQNLYEDAYYQLGIARIALKQGDQESVKIACRKALKRAEVSDPEAYLPEEAIRTVMTMLMLAELHTRDLAGAEATATALREHEEDPTRIEEFDKILSSIARIRQDPGSIDVAGMISEDYSWSIRLLKNRFSIQVQDGRLAELKLYCPTQFVGMPFDASLEYSIASKHGYCTLNVIGDPSTRFVLTQK